MRHILRRVQKITPTVTQMQKHGVQQIHVAPVWAPILSFNFVFEIFFTYNCSLDIDITSLKLFPSDSFLHYISKWVPPSCGQKEYSKLLTWHLAWFIALPAHCTSDSLSSVKNGETLKCVEMCMNVKKIWAFIEVLPRVFDRLMFNVYHHTSNMSRRNKC